MKIFKTVYRKNAQLSSEDTQSDYQLISYQKPHTLGENEHSPCTKRNCQPRVLYPAKLSFMNEDEIKKSSKTEI